jgi:hypothetical protein
MTTLPNGRLDSFKNRVWSTGLDRDRCRTLREPGVFKVDAAASFREGQPLMLNSSGLVVAHDGALTGGTRFVSPLLGVAKANCMSLGRATFVDEVVVFSAAGQTRNLRKGGIVSGSVKAVVAGTAETVATAPNTGVDFVVNLTNGTLQHDSANSNLSPSAGSPVTALVTYTVDLTASDYEFEGRNFFNQLNDVVTQDNMVTVIQAPSVVFTTEYDTSAVWAVGHAVSVSTGSLFSSLGVNGSVANPGLIVGYVASVPTASDPWLGIELVGSR